MSYYVTFTDIDTESKTYGQVSTCVYEDWDTVESVIGPLVKAKFIVTVSDLGIQVQHEHKQRETSQNA